jgi:cytosine/adenosine deaminase-related metal-dependent hydrolase/ubiquinone/menaquinone biosynthesis C-methylase UbiE
MASALPTSCLPVSDGYRLWASTYDSEANPMLSLERRMLESFLPPVKGLDVVDLGCGTGRWLEVLQGAGARSLIGVDLSPEMLSHARAKLGDAVRLVCADYVHASIDRSSADMVLCNFVLSYVDDPGALLRYVRKILRPGGSLFLSDIHPETATTLNWRRGVCVQEEFKEICTHRRLIPKVISLCEEAGLVVTVHLEPRFGAEERQIFVENGKQEYFEEIRNCPAIYVLQLRVPEKPKRPVLRETAPNSVGCLWGGRFALGPTLSAEGDMRIGCSRVQAILNDTREASPSSTQEACVDMRGYLALPGFINAHDHLEFALFPRLGRGGYKNFLEWAEDIHHAHASEIACHRRVPKRVRLWWGGIRNLLCGVTTVCHHNPYEPEVFSDGFVIRVLREYAWAHSLSLEPTAALKKRKSPKGRPFFIHLAEGIDERSGEELFDLERVGALNADTVIIHGLGIGATGRSLMRSTGAGLIWCPSSNLFLFGETLTHDEIRQFGRVALGSDSPLTAHGDLLDEVRCAHRLLQTPPIELYSYITEQPAGLLGLKNGEGTLRVGSFADLVAVRDMGLPPAETVTVLSYREIELVLLAGQVQLASPEMKQRLPQNACAGLQSLSIEGTVRWVRAPLDLLFQETTAHLQGEIYLGGRQVRIGSYPRKSILGPAER